MTFDRTTRTAIGISLVAGIVYPALGLWDEPEWGFVIKWLALAGVAFAVWRSWPGGAGFAFFLAVILHSIGDVLLVVDRKRLFLAGVIAFLFGHVIYAAVFYKGIPRPWPIRGRIAVIILPVHGIVMGWILIPRLPLPLAIAVTFYIGIILTMSVFAFSSDFTTTIVRFGALLYLVSDTLLSWNAFVNPLPTGFPVVWITYFGGQMMIIVGMLRRHGRLVLT